MGKVTFTATFSDGVSKSVTANIIDPEFIEGQWTKDKEGDQPLEKAVLGETVYFHVKTKGLANGREITLSLAEFDYSNSGYLLGHPVFRDIIDPDDHKFPEEEVIKKAKIQDGKAVVELLLQEKWEGMIKDDSDNAFSLDQNLELYWEVTYGSLKKELPTKENSYLKVGFNNRTLYIKTADTSFNLPELYSFKGEPMFLLEHAKGTIKTEMIDKSLSAATKTANTQIRKIALAKAIRDNMNENAIPFTKNFANDYYTNDPKLVEQLTNKTDWGSTAKTPNKNNPAVYYSKTGARVKILGLVGQVGDFLSLFDIISFAMHDGLDFNNPIPLDFGPLSAVAGVTGAFAQELKAEQNEILDEIVLKELDAAKQKGVEAVQQFINDYGHNERYKYDLLSISNATASKLMSGEFESLDDLLNYDSDFQNSSVKLLYKESLNKYKETPIETIEIIFINR